MKKEGLMDNLIVSKILSVYQLVDLMYLITQLMTQPMTQPMTQLQQN